MSESNQLADFPQPGKRVEALDLVGYWCEGKVLRCWWTDEVSSCGPERDDAGPGFEVQFEGWGKKWNRVVPKHEMREANGANGMNIKLFKCTSLDLNVRII